MAENQKTLFLLDAFALIFRAHFAFSKNPRINSKGVNTGVMLGFTNTLLEVLQKQKPTHIAVAFDTSAPTFRHEQFEAYKANRDETPEDIKIGTPIVKEIIRAFNIPIVEKDGYEADDVIGTIAKKAAREGFKVFMMTPDKDYAQLVEENIFLYKPAYMGNGVDIMGVEEVLAKWDIEKVDQVIDFLGLQGDSADNIPGIPGIGAKTAVKLLKAYGSVENLIKNVGDLKGKQKENVTNFAEQGLLSKELATICLDVPVEYDFQKMKYEGPDEGKLRPILEEMEFRTLAKRVFGDAGGKIMPSNPQLDLFGGGAAAKAMASSPDLEVSGEEVAEMVEKQSLETVETNYHFVDKKADMQALVDKLMLQKEFCFDTETTSINAVDAALVGFSFSYYNGDGYYVPVPEDEKEARATASIFKAVLENKDILKIGQNIKYDILVLKKYGIHVSGPIYDTMLAHYLIEPDGKHNMDVLAEQYLNYSPVSITSLIGPKGKSQKTMRDIPQEEISDYASEDADITFQLKTVLDPIVKDKKVDKLLHEVELPLVQVLSEMENNGVRLDVEVLKEMSSELAKDSELAEAKIYELAGVEFNIASPKQLGEVLFDKMKLVEKPKKTKTGQYATGEEILSKLAGTHEIASKILDFREYNKLKSTYVDALPALISPRDNRIHTTYSQAVAATGRLSSINPNLQNIPIRTEKGREIRKAFIPTDEAHTLLAADYSQIELRIMASFAGDEHMIQAFKEGRDIHATTAAKIFKIPLEEVDSDKRRKAKTANFGIIYGISAFGLAERLGIPRGEAKAIIDAYFEEFPSVKNYMDQTIAEAREKEYVETILGRRRYLRDINSRNAATRGFAERNAINAPIQGSAADIIKIAMINIHQWMQDKKVRSKMILQVHDELVFDVHNSELELFKKEIPLLMSAAVQLEVPMEVEAGTGSNWLQAH